MGYSNELNHVFIYFALVCVYIHVLLFVAMWKENIAK